MTFKFSPYSKKEQTRPSQKEKDKPDFKSKRQRKRRPKTNTNVEMYKNRKIPHWKKRGEIKTKEAIKALHHYGEECAVCQNPNYQLHHVVHKGYGIGGRGRWRNIVPLCLNHHTGADGVHTIIANDEYWKEKHHQQFGPYFHCDPWDLWMKGVIENPTEELFEKRMLLEEEKARDKASSGNEGA